MGALITPDQIPNWIPGEVTQDSSNTDWRHIVLRGYKYSNMVVNIPTMRDYMLVSYNQELPVQMRRRDDGKWNSSQVSKGNISILTREISSEWGWSEPIDVTHVYLTHHALSKVASEIFDKDVSDIEMFDVVSASDPVISSVISAIARELVYGELGGALYVELLRNQLSVLILRRYAKIPNNSKSANYGKLCPSQQRMLEEFIFENIANNISLEQLGGLINNNVHAFIRKFQATYSTTPHAYVMSQRVEHAKKMLSKGDSPIKVVAVNCGFSDQSHMTRIFRKELSLTPGLYRLMHQ